MKKEEAVKLDGVSGNLDYVIKVLQEYQERGESVYVEYNGVKLYSADITVDGAYKAVVGETKAEFDEGVREDSEKFKESQEKRRVKAEQNMSEWIERGEKLIPPEKQEAWKKYVEESVGSKRFRGEDVQVVLDIIEKFVSGTSQEQINKLMAEHEFEGAMREYVRQVVKEFYGEDIENIGSIEKKEQVENPAPETEDPKNSKYLVSSKDFADGARGNVGAKILKMFKNLFRFRNHNNIGGR